MGMEIAIEHRLTLRRFRFVPNKLRGEGRCKHLALPKLRS